MYSPRLCTPELFNQDWTREGALEMLTWIKYEKTHLPPPPSLFGKAMLTSGLFGSRICTDTNRHLSIWGKKGLEVITSLAVASLNITQEGRGSMKLLRFWLRNPFVKLRNGRRQFCHQHRSSPRGDHPRSLGLRSLGVVLLNVGLIIKEHVHRVLIGLLLRTRTSISNRLLLTFADKLFGNS